MNEFCVVSIALNSTLSTHNASLYSGGEGGIRTHGTVSRSQHFQCCQFNHSCTSPQGKDEVGRMKDEQEAKRRLSYSSLILHPFNLAERVGFEPTVEFPPLRFSRPVH